jgi:hypothetical protein
MATNIKITALSDITSANMTYNDLVAVVDMNGTPETKKSSVQLLGNLILGGAGGSNFVNAAIATLAGDVTNAAQPNITSTGTLVSSTVTGNVDAGNVNATTAIVAAYFSGDGANLTNLPSGANSTAIANGTSNVHIPASAGNVNTSVGGTANVLVITATGANVAGTLNTSGIVTGIGSGLSAIVGANVSGEVTNAATANAVAGANVSGEVTFAATANAVAYANVSGTPALGNISTINIDGAAGNVLYGNGAFAPVSSTTAQTVTTAAQPNITSTGTLTSLTVTGALGVTTGLITGDGGGISNIAVGNLVGTINLATFAGTANAVAGANVSGEVTFAATANAVAGANVSGTVPLATTAGTISTNAQPNITSTGTLTSLTVSGNVTGQSYVSAATALQTTPVITSALPAAATAGTGARAMVTDADAGSVFGAALTGAGSLTLPVFSDGTIWRVG